MTKLDAAQARNRSFAIAELAVAITVLAMVMTAIVTLVSLAYQGVRDAQERMAAAYVAEHHITLLRLDAADGSELPNCNDKPFPPDIDPPSILQELKCLLTIADESPERPGLKSVEVHLTWHDHQARQKQIFLESLIAERRP